MIEIIFKCRKNYLKKIIFLIKNFQKQEKLYKDFHKIIKENQGLVQKIKGHLY